MSGGGISYFSVVYAQDAERALALLEKFSNGTITPKELAEARRLLKRTGTVCNPGGDPGGDRERAAHNATKDAVKAE